MNQTLVM